jgi:hypothetical protein
MEIDRRATLRGIGALAATPFLTDPFRAAFDAGRCHIVGRRTREFYASNIIKRRQLPRAIHSSPPSERRGGFLLI